MTIFNLGSINIDHFYSVPHLPMPGETVAATGYSTGLGGKGANQSVAAARAGASVIHIGSVGPDGASMVARMREFGVDCAHVSTVETATAHAAINVAPDGENAIVIFSGANLYQSLTHLESAISAASLGDILMLQNETSLQREAAEIAKGRGLFVIYSAAPFSVGEAEAMFDHVDLLVMNAIEAEQLGAALQCAIQDLPLSNLLVTRGSEGATWYDLAHKRNYSVPAFAAEAVDTTGAGDCFVGYLAAGLDQRMDPKDALRLAAAAASIQVTRRGTSEAVPTRQEVDALLAGS